MPRLIVAGKKIALDFQFETAIGIGRHIANSLPLPDPEVSRHHAQVFPRDGEFVINDLGSHNGVYVNGHKVHEHVLKSGDEINVGGTLLFFDPPEKKDCSSLVSEHGRLFWEELPPARTYRPACVTVFAPAELDCLVSDWLDRKEKTALIPYKLRSSFLKLALEADLYTCRGDLCTAALAFLEARMGAQRAAVFAPDARQKRLEVLACLVSDDVPEEDRKFTAHKDILRVVLDARKAVYCAGCSTDFRFEHIVKKNETYGLQSFVGVPIHCRGEYFGFLYLDQPAGAPRYDFRCLIQAYITASLLGKCIHWYLVGKSRNPE